MLNYGCTNIASNMAEKLRYPSVILTKNAFFKYQKITEICRALECSGDYL